MPIVKGYLLPRLLNDGPRQIRRNGRIRGIVSDWNNENMTPAWYIRDFALRKGWFGVCRNDLAFRQGDVAFRSDRDNQVLTEWYEQRGQY